MVGFRVGLSVFAGYGVGLTDGGGVGLATGDFDGPLVGVFVVGRGVGSRGLGVGFMVEKMVGSIVGFMVGLIGESVEAYVGLGLGFLVGGFDGVDIASCCAVGGVDIFRDGEEVVGGVGIFVGFDFGSADGIIVDDGETTSYVGDNEVVGRKVFVVGVRVV